KVIDLIGYGAATDSEGGHAPALEATKAAMRGGKGCADTNDNSADFTAETPAPRNKTQTFQCPDPGPGSGDAGKEAGKEAGPPPPPVPDGPLGPEEPFDAGSRRDAGGGPQSSGADTSGCSMGLTAPRSAGTSAATGALVALGLALAARRRRR